MKTIKATRNWAAAAVLCAALALAAACAALLPAPALADQVSVTAQVPVRCTVVGSETADEAAAGEAFAFELTPVSESAPVPSKSTLTLDGASEGAFAMDFTQDDLGVWEYQLRQVPGSSAGWAYDDTVYNVRVQVFWYDDNFDKLVATVVYYDESGEKCDPVFENVAPEPVAPTDLAQTGDRLAVSAMALGIVAAACVIVVACALLRRRSKCEDA